MHGSLGANVLYKGGTRDAGRARQVQGHAAAPRRARQPGHLPASRAFPRTSSAPADEYSSAAPIEFYLAFLNLGHD